VSTGPGPWRAIVAHGSRSAGVPSTLPFEGRMRSNDLRQAQRLHLYGLVKGLDYLVRMNDLKAAQHLRGRLAWVLKYSNLAKPLHGDLEQLFQISGLWVRNVSNRRNTKRQIRHLIRRIIPRLTAPRSS
jgi:hypothetical protein